MNNTLPRKVKQPIAFQMFVRTVAACVPEGVRRIILLSSVIAYVVNRRDPERELVRDMDKTLRLSKGTDGESLRFGILISHLFWGDRELFKNEIEVLVSNASEQEKHRAATRFAQAIPAWFRYPNKDQIADDLSLYFSRYHPAA